MGGNTSMERSFLRNDQNWHAPEIRLLRCRVEDRDLAVVTSGSERAKADVEAEWHSSKPVGCARNDRGWRTLKDLLVSEIKADKSEERLARRRVTLRSLLISLQVYVHLVASPEDTSHAGHQFFPVRDKRIDRYFLFFVRTFFNVKERFLQIDALAAEHDGAD